MIIQLEVQPETAALLNDAQQRGVSIDLLLRETLKTEPTHQPKAPTSLQTFLQAMAAGAENAPVLPPEADERMFYYEGQE